MAQETANVGEEVPVLTASASIATNLVTGKHEKRRKGGKHNEGQVYTEETEEGIADQSAKAASFYEMMLSAR